MSNQIKDPNASHTHLSFAWHRGTVCLILIIIGYIQYREYGAAFNQENDIGNWLFLGGPSLFYPTGAIGWIFAGLLALYILGSLARITIIQDTSISDASDLLIKEWRYGIAHTTRIPFSQIENLRLSNRTVGWHWLWILAFGAHILYLFTEVWYYATNPYTFERGFDTMYYYVLQIGVEAVCLWILLYWQSVQLKIYTGEGVYYLNWHPVHSFPTVQNYLQAIFQMDFAQNEVKDTNKSNERRFYKAEATFAERRRRFGFFGVGAFWVMIGVLCRFGRWGFGEPLQYGLILCGLVYCYIQWINFSPKSYVYSFKSLPGQNKWESAILVPIFLFICIDIVLIGWAAIFDLEFIAIFLLHIGLGVAIFGSWYWVQRAFSESSIKKNSKN